MRKLMPKREKRREEWGWRSGAGEKERERERKNMRGKVGLSLLFWFSCVPWPEHLAALNMIKDL